jgi:hypothetical protein
MISIFMYTVYMFFAILVLAQSTGIILDVSRPNPYAQGNDFSYYADISEDGNHIAFQSNATNLLPGGVTFDLNGVSDIFVFDYQTKILKCASLGALGNPGNKASHNPSLSADGSIVVFNSQATDIISNDLTLGNDVFVHDLASGLTERVSVDSAGIASNGASTWADVSGDGSLVVFRSTADNLVAGDTNGFDDIFLHDRSTGVTSLISGIGADGPSTRPSISSGGDFVAFESLATNLVPGDVNSQSDIFLVELNTGTITRVSEIAGIGGDSGSSYASVSNGGVAVAFQSAASNLAPGDTGLATDVFYWRNNGSSQTLVRISEASGLGEAQGASRVPDISKDGYSVAFQSLAPNLVVGDNNNKSDIFIWDQSTSHISIVSVSVLGDPADDYSLRPSVSGDGLRLAFESAASNIVSPDNNQRGDVFLLDLDPILDRATLAGPTSIPVGSAASYTLVGDMPLASYNILGSRSLGGYVFKYHYFDLGAKIYNLDGGYLDSNSQATFNTGVIPARLSGRTIYLEAYIDQANEILDSNSVTVSIL